jgi:hypothetical protein
MGKVIKTKLIKNVRFELLRYLRNKQFVFTILITDLESDEKPIEYEYDAESINDHFVMLTTYTYADKIA